MAQPSPIVEKRGALEEARTIAAVELGGGWIVLVAGGGDEGRVPTFGGEVLGEAAAAAAQLGLPFAQRGIVGRELGQHFECDLRRLAIVQFLEVEVAETRPQADA